MSNSYTLPMERFLYQRTERGMRSLENLTNNLQKIIKNINRTIAKPLCPLRLERLRAQILTGEAYLAIAAGSGFTVNSSADELTEEQSGKREQFSVEIAARSEVLRLLLDEMRVVAEP